MSVPRRRFLSEVLKRPSIIHRVLLEICDQRSPLFDRTGESDARIFDERHKAQRFAVGAYPIKDERLQSVDRERRCQEPLEVSLKIEFTPGGTGGLGRCEMLPKSLKIGPKAFNHGLHQ